MNKREAKAARIRSGWKKIAPEPAGARPDDAPQELPPRAAVERATPDARGFLRGRLAIPVREVAKLLGISDAAVRLMIHRGDLPGKKVGVGCERITYVIPTAALLEWLDAATPAAAEGAA